MPQRDKAPPEEWEPRADRESRRAFERFEDKLRAEFEGVVTQLNVNTNQRFTALEREYVTYRSFAIGLLGMLGALLLAVGFIMSPTKEAAVSASQKVDRSEETLAKRLAIQDEKLAAQKADIEAVMRVTVDGKPRKQAREEWESKTGSRRVDANP